MIRSLAHVALQVTDLEGSLRHASEVLGMRVVERVDGRAYLTLGSQHNTYGGAHHVIEYFEGPVTALEHVAFRAASPEGLEQLRHRLQKAGVAVRAGEIFMVPPSANQMPILALTSLGLAGIAARPAGNAAFDPGGDCGADVSRVPAAIRFAKATRRDERSARRVLR
jgi:catechol 2,3-dioxygenase-like lactoylglutathione lyase family enzyme